MGESWGYMNRTEGKIKNLGKKQETMEESLVEEEWDWSQGYELTPTSETGIKKGCMWGWGGHCATN